MITRVSHKQIKEEMRAWAKELLKTPFLVLDSETTGLDNQAEIVQIAVLNSEGATLFCSLVKPTVPMDENSRAFQISGITNDMLKDSPSFQKVWFELEPHLWEKKVLVYNAPFDKRLIEQSLAKYPVETPWMKLDRLATWIDVMVPYSDYVGEWNDYHQNYKWQKLPGTVHSPVEDCRAVLKVLQDMARDG